MGCCGSTNDIKRKYGDNHNGVANSTHTAEGNNLSANHANNPTTRNTCEPVDASLENESWYFGKIDINRCMKLLGNSRVTEGTFIVRDSTSASGSLCISVKGRSSTGQCVFSVRIGERQNGLGCKQYHSAVDNRIFSSIPEVIQYYKEHGIHANGYSVRLQTGLENRHYYLGGDGQTDTSFQIREEDLDLQEEVGRGHFGSVIKGRWRKPDGEYIHVAVKKLHSDKKAEVEKFEKEVNVLRMVFHDNIVTYIGVCNEQCPMIVTELMSKGDLLKFLRSNDKGRALQDLYYFALEVASGMKFLASKNIIHRDLAARNVLLGEQHIVKIADFGLSRIVDNDDKIYLAKAAELPVKWTAPEGLEPPRSFTTKSDVWSYGIFLTEVITRGRTPYPSIHIEQITKTRLVDQGYRMTREILGTDCSESLYALMKECWQSDPDLRPDFEMIYQEIHRLYQPFVPISHA